MAGSIQILIIQVRQMHDRSRVTQFCPAESAIDVRNLAPYTSYIYAIALRTTYEFAFQLRFESLGIMKPAFKLVIVVTVTPKRARIGLMVSQTISYLAGMLYNTTPL